MKYVEAELEKDDNIYAVCERKLLCLHKRTSLWNKFSR